MRTKYKLQVLQIETTNICNGKCKFCIHNTLTSYGTMSDKLFKKILKDACAIRSLKIIIPMLLGEPFLDKKIIKRLKLINKMLPKIVIHLFTNGSFLTPENINQLKNIDNLVMHFSLNGMNKETRLSLMGLDDYEHVIEMIKLYEKTEKPFEVLFVDHPSVSDEEVIEFKKLSWNKTLLGYKNWSGDKFEANPQTKCKRAISEMTIMHDGRVNLCCMEYGKVIFGDVNEKSVKEIWDSPHRQMYCEAHSKGKFLLGVCSNCTKA